MSAFNPVFKNVHPMILQEYAIYTPPIAEIFEVICEWIENKVPGGYIYGISRLGKSRAVKFWLSVLIEEQYKGRIVFFSRGFQTAQRPLRETVLTNAFISKWKYVCQGGHRRRHASETVRSLSHECHKSRN